jgi:hypothetical protein
MIKKSLSVVFAIMLSLSTLIAYAWWDQLQVSLDVIELEIGYGSRITLSDLTTANQGALVPEGSANDGRPGYTTEYTFAFQLNFSEDLVDFDLTIELGDVTIHQAGVNTPYDRTLPKYEALHMTLMSLDNSIDFFPTSTLEITSTQTIIGLTSDQVSLPTSFFELIVTINESDINEETVDALAGATFSFDLMVEVTV